MSPAPAFTALDARMALRAVLRTPTLSLLAIAALAVAVALSTTAFTVLQGIYGTELPFDEPQQIVQVGERHVRQGYITNYDAEQFTRLRQEAQSFTELGAFHERSLTVGLQAGEGAPATAAFVTPDSFELIGATAEIGRTLQPFDRDASEPVVVLGHELFTQRFGADRELIGELVFVGDQAHRVVGVMPEGFAFPSNDQLWIAVETDPASGRATSRSLRVFGRLVPGTTSEQAEAELRTLAVRRLTEHGEPETLPWVRSFTGAGATGFGFFAAILGGLVLVLLVTAANIANLLIARNAGRHDEMALRTALGASRARLVGQLFVESLLLGVAASVVGALAARWAIGWFERIAGDELPFWADLRMDLPVLAFVVAISTLVAAVASLAPALSSTRRLSGVARASHNAIARPELGRLGAVLVVAEVALSVGLLGGAAGLGRALFGYSYQDLGLPAEQLLVSQIYFGQPPEPAPGAPESPNRWRDWSRQCLERMEALRSRIESWPEVHNATYASQFPGNERDQPDVFELDSSGASGGSELASTQVIDSGPDFLETLGATALIGRGFYPEELTEQRPVALVNQPFAERFLDGSALGARIRVARAESIERAPWREIVGVIPDLGLSPADPASAHGVYVPHRPVNIFRLAVHARGSPAELIPRLHFEVGAIDPAIDVQWTTTLEEQMALPVTIFRALGVGLLLVGGLSLLLCAASLYAILSFSVTRRISEIGLRRSLGARSADVLRTILGRGAVQLVAGGLVGAVIGTALSRALPAVVPFAIGSQAGWLILATAAVLCTLGLFACVTPARRALRLDPQEALRHA